MGTTAADTDDQPVRRHLVVRGLVQGVFYRESSRREAERLSISGWVQNNPDGTVEAEVEGAADAVERMIAWCRRGPSRAHVERVDLLDREPTGQTGFTVR